MDYEYSLRNEEFEIFNGTLLSEDAIFTYQDWSRVDWGAVRDSAKYLGIIFIFLITFVNALLMLAIFTKKNFFTNLRLYFLLTLAFGDILVALVYFVLRVKLEFDENYDSICYIYLVANIYALYYLPFVYSAGIILLAFEICFRKRIASLWEERWKKALTSALISLTPWSVGLVVVLPLVLVGKQFYNDYQQWYVFKPSKSRVTAILCLTMFVPTTLAFGFSLVLLVLKSKGTKVAVSEGVPSTAGEAKQDQFENEVELQDPPSNHGGQQPPPADDKPPESHDAEIRQNEAADVDTLLPTSELSGQPQEDNTTTELYPSLTSSPAASKEQEPQTYDHQPQVTSFTEDSPPIQDVDDGKDRVILALVAAATFAFTMPAPIWGSIFFSQQQAIQDPVLIITLDNSVLWLLHLRSVVCPALWILGLV